MASPKGSVFTTARTNTSLTLADEFRGAISAAQANGTNVDSMVLHLTLRDESSLRRDRSVPLEDIRYSEGQMRFLGVKVVVSQASGLTITPA